MAKIMRVTITGADDTTDPHRLLSLSDRFPFVEWGLLFGAGVGPDTPWGEGRPRFPSHSWVLALIELGSHYDQDPDLSYHLCGKYMRAAIGGTNLVREGMIDVAIWQSADRIQLNFHAVPEKVRPVLLARLIEGGYPQQWILQVDGVNDHVVAEIREHTKRAVPLFDRSGGAGIVPSAWPKSMDMFCGYAGGLGPDNLEAEIAKIREAAGKQSIWLDMETKVRNDADTRLDLDRVEAALAICEPHIGEHDLPDSGN